MIRSPSRLSFTLALLLATAAPAIAADSTKIGDAFRQTLMRLALSGELPGQSDGALLIERPAERVANFGLLVDRDHDQGLLVLGTLPGASAEHIGFRAGDRLVEADGIALTGVGGSARMRAFLEDLEGSRDVRFTVLRDGREHSLAGTVETVSLPAMRVELLPAAAAASSQQQARVAGDADSRCGRVTVFPASPRTRDLFPARLIAVDGELPGPSSQDTFRLSPGRHVLTVAELIDERYFSAIANQQRSRRGRDAYKTLEIDVQPGVTYLLAAHFIRDQDSRILDGGYWRPVIWKERAEACR